MRVIKYVIYLTLLILINLHIEWRKADLTWAWRHKLYEIIKLKMENHKIKDGCYDPKLDLSKLSTWSMTILQ